MNNSVICKPYSTNNYRELQLLIKGRLCNSETTFSTGIKWESWKCKMKMSSQVFTLLVPIILSVSGPNQLAENFPIQARSELRHFFHQHLSPASLWGMSEAGRIVLLSPLTVLRSHEDPTQTSIRKTNTQLFSEELIIFGQEKKKREKKKG